ncbi:MAG: hypothetical protein EON47_13090, partial [Acetobacteraceae bacterium]
MSGIRASGPATDFVRAMGPVARALLGEPSQEIKAKRELRFGTRGSLAVSLDKGTWHDHEAGRGGGVLDLVRERKALDHDAALAWLQDQGHIPKAERGGSAPKRQVAAYDYTSADGELLFQVVRFEPKDFRPRRPDALHVPVPPTQAIRPAGPEVLRLEPHHLEQQLAIRAGVVVGRDLALRSGS